MERSGWSCTGKSLRKSRHAQSYATAISGTLGFSVEIPGVEKFEPKTSVGIDLGINTLTTLSDSTAIKNPKTLDKHDSKLRKAQKDLPRKKKGSNN
ncbi:MAG: hypothetical protein EF813_11315 [Methanosarcinales archaeon]|nr:MAG: hypothetical protein EF813_11315 [Methanosarcinales archaeon]